jgi:hypothetical protein
VLVEVARNAGTRNLTLVHPDVKPVSPRNLPQSSHCLLRQQSNLGDFSVSCLVIRVDVTVWADQKVPCVVREKVQQDEAGFPAVDDQSVFVCLTRT